MQEPFWCNIAFSLLWEPEVSWKTVVMLEIADFAGFRVICHHKYLQQLSSGNNRHIFPLWHVKQCDGVQVFLRHSDRRESHEE